MLRFPATFGHNSFAFNEHLDAAGAVVLANVHATVTIDEREVNTGFRDLRDPYHLTTGGALGRSHKNFTSIRLGGRIQAPDASQAASLSDKERALLAAFDPALCYRDSPTTEGAYAFDFTERTTDTTTYPTGLIALRYYCRPAEKPRIREATAEFGSKPYALSLIAGDPRCYEQTEQTLSLTPAAASGNVVNRGTVPAPLRATITMAGAGNAAFTITRAGVAFILNLAGMVASDVVVVTFETCGPYGEGKIITKNGTRNFALKTSSPSTWLDVPVGTTSFAISNHTNVTSCVLAWRSARA